MELNATGIFERTLEAKTKIIVHQGGARSSKTYSIMQYVIMQALKGKVVTVARKNLTWLKSSAMVDFKDILTDAGLWHLFTENKTDSTYRTTKGIIAFIGLDEAQKLRGRKQDIFWLNEADECGYEDFRQAILRTKEQVLLDFNPSHEFHWIYDHVLTRPDCTFIQSTFKDNPFLPDEIRKEIESLKDSDPDYWRVFGLGERGKAKELIYNQWNEYTVAPVGNVAYGLDFGFNHPTALIKCTYTEKSLYWQELIYQSGLTTPELIQMLKQVVSHKDILYCDYARPEIIQELRIAGLNAQNATKEVKNGIDRVKSCNLFIHKDSHNLIKEIQNYKWKVHANGATLDEPVKFKDDACFIGSTLILTDKGLKPIAEINVGDMVLTRAGYKKVLNVFNNGVKQVNKYLMQCDTINVYLCSTNNHLVSTNNEWTQISQLKSGQTICHIKHLTELNTSCIRAEDTLCSINTICTTRYGNTITAKDQKAFMFTILTAILGITILPIFNLLKQASIYLNIAKRNLLKILNGLKTFTLRVLKQPKNGIVHPKGLSGIGSTGQTLGLIKNIKSEPVKFAAKFTRQDIQDCQGSVIKTAKLLSLGVGESWSEPVFDLEVEDCHEYFANGVLVHNCDAGRYGSYNLVPLTGGRRGIKASF